MSKISLVLVTLILGGCASSYGTTDDQPDASPDASQLEMPATGGGTSITMATGTGGGATALTTTGGQQPIGSSLATTGGQAALAIGGNAATGGGSAAGWDTATGGSLPTTTTTASIAYITCYCLKGILGDYIDCSINDCAHTTAQGCAGTICDAMCPADSQGQCQQIRITPTYPGN